MKGIGAEQLAAWEALDGTTRPPRASEGKPLTPETLVTVATACPGTAFTNADGEIVHWGNLNVTHELSLAELKGATKGYWEKRRFLLGDARVIRYLGLEKHFPKIMEAAETVDKDDVTDRDGVTDKGGVTDATQARRKEILRLLAGDASVTAEKLAEATQASKRTILRDLEALKEQGALLKHGTGNQTTWEVVEKEGARS
jgi:DNA-binding transcriptional ArsR family regulator